MINTYKPRSSFLFFPTLVYLVLLAPIDPLVISSGFRQVFALLLSRRFLSKPLNPWDISIWDCNIETPSMSTCTFATGRTFDPTRSMLVPTQAKHNKRLARYLQLPSSKPPPFLTNPHQWTPIGDYEELKNLSTPPQNPHPLRKNPCSLTPTLTSNHRKN